MANRRKVDPIAYLICASVTFTEREQWRLSAEQKGITLSRYIREAVAFYRANVSRETFVGEVRN